MDEAGSGFVAEDLCTKHAGCTSLIKRMGGTVPCIDRGVQNVLGGEGEESEREES